MRISLYHQWSIHPKNRMVLICASIQASRTHEFDWKNHLEEYQNTQESSQLIQTWVPPDGTKPRRIPLLIVIADTVPPCKYQRWYEFTRKWYESENSIA